MTMRKHNRLMNALAEIKLICAKNGDFETGCSRKCPFIMGSPGDEFRDCEVMLFIKPDTSDTPEDWGECDDER